MAQPRDERFATTATGPAEDRTDLLRTLECLRSISCLLATSGSALDESLLAALALIPTGWRSPGDLRVRLAWDEHELASPGFRETPWRLVTSLRDCGTTIGTVEVCYLERRPTFTAGPFLPEEQELLVDIAGQLGLLIGRQRLATERRQLEEHLRRSQRFEAIGRLAGGVAHELNNPLSVVLGFAQILLDEAEATSTQRECASAIVEHCERLAALVRHLHSISSAIAEPREPHDLGALVQGVLLLLRPSLRHDRIEEITRIADGLPWVPCRRQQVQQVLLNLVANAREALNQRFPTASPEKVLRILVQPIEQAGATWVQVSVEDQGCGLDPAFAEQIFKPLFTTKPEGEGIGLGLTISQQIVQEHEGRLWFTSQPGAGFQIHLELAAETEGESR